jgi:hypothetical protein
VSVGRSQEPGQITLSKSVTSKQAVVTDAPSSVYVALNSEAATPAARPEAESGGSLFLAGRLLILNSAMVFRSSGVVEESDGADCHASGNALL